VATIAAVTLAVSCVALTYFTVSAVVFHFAVAALAKLVPLMVSVKAAEPAVTLDGLRPLIVGADAVPRAAGVIARARHTEAITENHREKIPELSIGLTSGENGSPS
jgi:hypothetical protein